MQPLHYLGILVSERKQAINGWCPEMWLPACVGCGSRKDEHPPDRDAVHPSRA
jgi:hypothetical protein